MTQKKLEIETNADAIAAWDSVCDVPPSVTANGSSSALIETILHNLRQTLEQHRGERQIVVIQDFPDPDALSSAWAYQLIAEPYQIQCDIVYAGTLSHQENIALVKLTGLPAKRWGVQTLADRDLSVYQGCVLVDSQGNNSQLMPLVRQANIPIVVLIDHHCQQGKVEAEFIDLRPSMRATATIFAQYLQAGIIDFTVTNSTHVKCATALMHGIRSDTANLLQSQEADLLSAAYLSRIYDPQLLTAVLQSARSRKVMDAIERALKNRSIQNNFSIAGIGYLSYEDRDAIPQAADFLVTEENIHTAVVYGIVHDRSNDLELAIGSLRTNKLTLDPDEFLKETLGKDANGRYFGGGRDMAGGFEIPIGFLSGSNDNSEYTKLKWETFDTQIKQKLRSRIAPDDKLIHS